MSPPPSPCRPRRRRRPTSAAPPPGAAAVAAAVGASCTSSSTWASTSPCPLPPAWYDGGGAARCLRPHHTEPSTPLHGHAATAPSTPACLSIAANGSASIRRTRSWASERADVHRPRVPDTRSSGTGSMAAARPARGDRETSPSNSARRARRSGTPSPSRSTPRVRCATTSPPRRSNSSCTRRASATSTSRGSPRWEDAMRRRVPSRPANQLTAQRAAERLGVQAGRHHRIQLRRQQASSSRTSAASARDSGKLRGVANWASTAWRRPSTGGAST